VGTPALATNYPFYKESFSIQVTATSDEQNNDREVNGLLEAMEYHKLTKGYILTLDNSEERKIEDKEILIMPVWKWMLSAA